MNTKKGQGLSLNAIIIAALALIVLVVLAVIFTSRAGQTEQGVEKVAGEASLELTKLKIGYGECHPSSSLEQDFLRNYADATSADGKDQTKDDFRVIIQDCKRSDEKAVCEQTSGCDWS